MLRSSRFLFVSGIIIAILVVHAEPPAITSESPKYPQSLASILSTYTLINEEYIAQETIDKQSLIKGALEGLIGALPEDLAQTIPQPSLQNLETQESSQAESRPVKDLKPVVNTYQKILSEVTPEPSFEKEKLLKGAISGMLEVLGDKYSAVYTSEEFEKARMAWKGNYVGLGFELTKMRDSVQVFETYPGTPASRSSLRPGDIILKIDGRSIRGMSFDKVMEKLDGTRGTTTRLLIEHRDGDRQVITLTRQKVKMPAVEYELLAEDKIVLLDINRFTSGISRELKRCLKKTETRFLTLTNDETEVNSTQLGKSYGLLGNAYANREKYVKAKKFYEYARQIFEKRETETRIFLAQTYDNLGSVYQNRGKLEKAIKFHQKALAAYREITPEKKYEIARTYGNIGSAYIEQGDNKKAVQEFNRATKIFSKAPDEEKIFLGQIFYDLGLVLKKEKKLELAIEHLKQAAKIFKESSGSYSHPLSRVYGTLASTYREKDEIDKTLDYYQKESKAKRNASNKKSNTNLRFYGNLKGGYGENGRTEKDLEKCKKEIMALQGFRGLIIDLRNNTGGSLNPTISAISEFVDSGLIVESFAVNDQHRTYNSLGNSFPDFPVAVLINDETASAAELFAAVIRDRQKGILVGRRSFGKSSVQTIYKINEGFRVKFTTKKLHTPSAKNVPNNGLKPDLNSPNYLKDLPIAKDWITTNAAKS
ncbi:tetratricopeptide repeat protein [Candidatus Bipolaricaulota bacterium]|nr:tetratricopeptide repeat protein [Candidatus Bipolaricaulota bacterium]